MGEWQIFVHASESRKNLKRIKSPATFLVRLESCRPEHSKAVCLLNGKPLTKVSDNSFKLHFSWLSRGINTW